MARILIVTADDYGYSPAYDRGILEAARAGTVDAVSVLVRRERVDPKPLLATGVEIGLHLELEAPEGRGGAEPERGRAVAELEGQLSSFERSFGRRAAYLDGHHHAHAVPALAAAIARVAVERQLPVRSVDAWHRQLLRRLRVSTPNHLIGRMAESEPARPLELDDLPDRVTEWMVHPGHHDPNSGSDYDAGREEDLQLLLELGDRESWLERGIERRSHTEALG